jgi:hypothetical protein
MTKSMIGLAFVFFFTHTVSAHEPRPGPNGGLKVDAGSQFHAELVLDGTTQVVIFLYDANDQPVTSEGYRANAILVVNGVTQRFPLRATNDNKLVGTAPVGIPRGVKGAVQLIAPNGATAQAKY